MGAALPSTTRRQTTRAGYCRRWRVGKTFAHNLISRGTLKKRYAGKRLLFTAASAASWFDSLPDQPPNAFTADELIAWIEDKLREQGIEKVVPDDKMLETAYRRAAEAKYFRGHSKPILEDAAAVAIPPDLGKKVSDKLGSGPELPWDRAVWDVVQEGGE